MRMAGWAAALALALAALAWGAHRFPPDSCPWLYPQCPSHALFGVYCPGCGSTRMLVRLAHGDLAGAFAKNPLAFLLLPLLAYGLGAELARLAGRRWPTFPRRAWTVYVLLAVTLLYGALRNIPAPVFDCLRPH